MIDWKICWIIKKSSSPFNKSQSEERISSTNWSKDSKRGSTGKIYLKLLCSLHLKKSMHLKNNLIINKFLWTIKNLKYLDYGVKAPSEFQI